MKQNYWLVSIAIPVARAEERQGPAVLETLPSDLISCDDSIFPMPVCVPSELHDRLACSGSDSDSL